MTAAGGLGLFLLGMIVMTNALQRLAGDALRRVLFRFTRSPLSGAVSGAVCTAILQSSSATTVATIGFVAAGLMGFSAALGIIFGANIGTTMTGWLVALLGFKLKLGTAVLPVILFGTVLALFGRRRVAAAGLALAGFGLVFVGIAMLQEGMSGLAGAFDFQRFPGDTFGGRLLLVGIGIAFTIVTQSSSAGIAATLTALNGGFIDLYQGAALVVGMDIGTTITAAIATLGASTAARRTGYSHVVYNLMTGALAYCLIAPYLAGWQSFAPGQLATNPELVLVAFHTLFNALGVMLVLPFTGAFANLMLRLVPDRGPAYATHLDPALLEQPPLALSSAQEDMAAQFLAALDALEALISDRPDPDLDALRSALDQMRVYLDSIHLQAETTADWPRLLALLHALDHLDRLQERLEDEGDCALTAARRTSLAPQRTALLACLNSMRSRIAANDWSAAADAAEAFEQEIREAVTQYRDAVVARIANGELDVETGTARLEASRWLRRVTHHLARITRYFGGALLAAGERGGS